MGKGGDGSGMVCEVGYGEGRGGRRGGGGDEERGNVEDAGKKGEGGNGGDGDGREEMGKMGVPWSWGRLEK